jgi:hypothetical protein
MDHISDEIKRIRELIEAEGVQIPFRSVFTPNDQDLIPMNQYLVALIHYYAAITGRSYQLRHLGSVYLNGVIAELGGQVGVMRLVNYGYHNIPGNIPTITLTDFSGSPMFYHNGAPAPPAQTPRNPRSFFSFIDTMGKRFKPDNRPDGSAIRIATSAATAATAEGKSAECLTGLCYEGALRGISGSDVFDRVATLQRLIPCLEEQAAKGMSFSSANSFCNNSASSSSVSSSSSSNSRILREQIEQLKAELATLEAQISAGHPKTGSKRRGIGVGTPGDLVTITGTIENLISGLPEQGAEAGAREEEPPAKKRRLEEIANEINNGITAYNSQIGFKSKKEERRNFIRSLILRRARFIINYNQMIDLLKDLGITIDWKAKREAARAALRRLEENMERVIRNERLEIFVELRDALDELDEGRLRGDNNSEQVGNIIEILEAFNGLFLDQASREQFIRNMGEGAQAVYERAQAQQGGNIRRKKQSKKHTKTKKTKKSKKTKRRIRKKKN